MIMTTDEGSGTASNIGMAEARAVSATKLAHTGINNSFMSHSVHRQSANTNKPTAQNKVAGTIEFNATSSTSSHWSRYLFAAVLALLFNAACPAQDGRLVELKLPAHFDPFAVDTKVQYETAARAACATPKPVDFIGYHWRLPPVAAQVRQMAGDSPGKQIYINFLKTKYGYQIASVNADFGTDAQSFTELLESPIRSQSSKYDAEFDAPARHDMVEGILAALRKCDEAHAAAGLRFLLEQSLRSAHLFGY